MLCAPLPGFALAVIALAAPPWAGERAAKQEEAARDQGAFVTAFSRCKARSELLWRLSCVALSSVAWLFRLCQGLFARVLSSAPDQRGLPVLFAQ